MSQPMITTVDIITLHLIVKIHFNGYTIKVITNRKNCSLLHTAINKAMPLLNDGLLLIKYIVHWLLRKF